MPEIRQMRRDIRTAREELRHAKAWLAFYLREGDFDAVAGMARQCEIFTSEVALRQHEYETAFRPKLDQAAQRPVAFKGWQRVTA